MNTKSFFTIIIIALMPYLVTAQKKAVAIMPFVYAKAEDKATALQLQEFVVSIIAKRNNIQLIDRSKDSLLMRELKNQIRSVSVNAKKLAEQGKVLGAEEMIVGSLTKVMADKVHQVEGKFSGLVYFSLQVVDVATGIIKNPVVVDGTTKNTDEIAKLGGLDGLLGTGGGTLELVMADSKEEAIKKAIESSRELIAKWINKTYPLEIKIFKVETRKNNFPETVLVAGLEKEIKVGAKIKISEVIILELDGDKLKQVKKIATLKVLELQGDVTLCKFTDGEKEIEEKLRQKTTLQFDND